MKGSNILMNILPVSYSLSREILFLVCFEGTQVNTNTDCFPLCNTKCSSYLCTSLCILMCLRDISISVHEEHLFFVSATHSTPGYKCTMLFSQSHFGWTLDYLQPFAILEHSHAHLSCKAIYSKKFPKMKLLSQRHITF